MDNTNEKQENKYIRWFKKVGILGFLFFLGKGLVWLYIFYAAGKCAVE